MSLSFIETCQVPCLDGREHHLRCLDQKEDQAAPGKGVAHEAEAQAGCTETGLGQAGHVAMTYGSDKAVV